VSTSRVPKAAHEYSEHSKPLINFARIDRGVLLALLAVLAICVFLFGRANIIADSVDYYVNLQWLSPEGGETIVRNTHFASQRSPGYGVCALLPHLLLLYLVDPVVRTTRSGLPNAGPPGPPGLIPPQPLLLRELLFRDFPVPAEGTWFHWNLALALALTSYGFLFAGLMALASTLRLVHPYLPGYALIAILLLGSPIFVHNIFATPLYATLTAFGASALFGLRFTRAMATSRPMDGFAAGGWLGLIVLTRLETAIFAAAVGVWLVVRGERTLCLRLIAGASWAAFAWVAYNYRVFGVPFSFGILRGDINLVRYDPSYILRCLVHPSSGLLFWSAPVCLGLLGLVLSKSPPLKCLGIAAFPLVALWVVRVPMMIAAPDQAMQIGGLPVMPALGEGGALLLIRSDINRYATVLAPFAVLGLRDLADRWRSSSRLQRPNGPE
jgi:hypothetical protein